MDPTCLTHAELADALRALRLGVDASDLHGSLSGLLCGSTSTPSHWLEALQLDVDDPAVVQDRTLERLHRECRAQFAAAPASVDPLLPAPSAALPQRADALVEWCRGFLGGIGLSGAITRAPLSEEARGILDDLGMIAASKLEYAGTREDQRAFEEVLDFVRAAVAVLHADLNRRAPARALH